MRQKITIPIPPSVNKMFIFNKYTHQKIYKQETRDYYEYNTLVLGNWVKTHHVKPVAKYEYFDMKFFLKNSSMDSHNLKKVAFDLLEKAGVVENDKWILDRTQSIEIDKENPRIEISWLSPA
jgi:Holliday junction resolvase RusA-like endonuclease